MTMIIRVIPPSVEKYFPMLASHPEIVTGDFETMEAVLMQQLDFELIVHHPYRIINYVAVAAGCCHVLDDAKSILNDP